MRMGEVGLSSRSWRFRGALLAGLLVCTGPALADVRGGAVKIGVLTDESGMLADMAGPGSIIAAQMAVEDFGGTVLGVPVQVVHADHQNKADIGAGIARRWFDTEGVDMVIDLVNSSVALAVTDVGRTLGRVTIAVTPGSLDIIGKQCSPYGALWVYDTYATSAALARTLVAHGEKELVLPRRRLRVRPLDGGAGDEGDHRLPAARWWARRSTRSAPRISPATC